MLYQHNSCHDNLIFCYSRHLGMLDTTMDTNITINKYLLTNTVSNLTSNCCTNETEELFVSLCNNTSCLPIAVFLGVTSLIGMAANIIVISVIVKDQRLHRPTFFLICSLAGADFTFLFTRLPRYIMRFFADDTNLETYRYTRLVLDIVGLFAGSASVIHIVVMAALRYFIVVHPLRSHVCLTNIRVFLTSICVWTFAFGTSAWYSYGLIALGLKSKVFQYTNFVITVFYSVLPMLLIALLHFFKARELLISLSECSSTTVRNMSRVVTVVIVCFLITTTPANVVDILVISFGYRYSETKTFFVLSQVSKIMLHLNFTANPFIYFAHSSQFQKSIKRCCCPCHRQTDSNNTTLSYLQSSSIKSEASIQFGAPS